MSRSTVVYRTGAALLLAGLGFACSNAMKEASPGSVATAPGVSTLDRKTVRTADQEMVVDSPVTAGHRVERMFTDAGGYIERSTSSSDGDVRIVGRVPASKLDSIMTDVASLGRERRRHTTGADVTDQYTDLEARLRSTIALRDRLQQLLSRAATLDEVLNLEKQIARLQADIDALQARIDQLKTQVELASLAVDLQRKHVPGPLAVVGRGIAGLVTKLFVIR
ncbi:MAG TPA: DUF4349 domain-containing protein [Gemmatimonadales bacterium]|nr:DUF4349 domain-containing protein [Gemmatimonadales bacterium]